MSFTAKDERKLKSAIGRYGREWSTIRSRLFSRFPIAAIKAKGLAIIKASPESKARAVKVKSILSKCEKNLSFTRLLKKFSESRVKAYLRFLTLKAVQEDFDCDQLSPSAEVDQVWHFHLLDTRHYRETCEQLCGKGFFIDHDADGGQDTEARDARRAFAAELTEEIALSVDKPKLKNVSQSDRLRDLNLKVVTQDGNEIVFNLKQTTPLGKLMEAYCNRHGVALDSVRFLFDGHRLRTTDTPWRVHDTYWPSPHMQDGDVIDVVVEQQGC